MAHAGIGADVEGFHAVAAAVAAGRVQTLLVEEHRLRDQRYADLSSSVRSGGGVIEVVVDAREWAVTTAPQGLVAKCRPIESSPLETALVAVEPAAIVVLDHIEDARNVGAVARSAVASGFGGLVVSSDRAAPLGAAAFKAAAGALERLSLVVVTSIADAVRRLEKLDVWTVGLDGSADRSLLGLDLLSQPVALVVGAEGGGLSRLVADRVSVRAHLPMVGQVESFNASVAATLAMYEVARVRGWIA